MITPLVALVALAALALAFANGANDHAKAVATRICAGRLSVAGGVGYATGATCLGAVAAVLLGRALLARFSGKGIVAAELLPTPELPPAVGAGAGLTVLLATRLGLPISTTHALA